MVRLECLGHALGEVGPILLILGHLQHAAEPFSGRPLNLLFPLQSIGQIEAPPSREQVHLIGHQCTSSFARHRLSTSHVFQH